jgi:hypothetical protein
MSDPKPMAQIPAQTEEQARAAFQGISPSPSAESQCDTTVACLTGRKNADSTSSRFANLTRCQETSWKLLDEGSTLSAK